MQPAERLAGHDRSFGDFGLGARALGRQGDETVQQMVEMHNPGEVRFSQLDGRQLTGGDELQRLGDGEKSWIRHSLLLRRLEFLRHEGVCRLVAVRPPRR